jgi:predicted metalloendopeptidase
MNLQPVDELTPEQRFFVGFAQWDCANERPDDLRVRAATDPHSPAKYRINGVVVNMPEFAKGVRLQSRSADGASRGAGLQNLVSATWTARGPSRSG